MMHSWSHRRREEKARDCLPDPEKDIQCPNRLRSRRGDVASYRGATPSQRKTDYLNAPAPPDRSAMADASPPQRRSQAARGGVLVMRRQTVAATAGGRRAVLVDGLTVSVAPVARQRDAAAELIVINTLSYPEPIVWSPPAWRTSVPGPSAAEHDNRRQVCPGGLSRRLRGHGPPTAHA